MAGAEITFQGALSVAKVVEIPDRCRNALQAGGLLIDRGAACRTEEPARTRYPVPKCQLTLEPALKLRTDFRAVCLRVGRVEDRRKTRREVKPRGELVASVHNVEVPVRLASSPIRCCVDSAAVSRLAASNVSKIRVPEATRLLSPLFRPIAKVPPLDFFGEV